MASTPDRTVDEVRGTPDRSIEEGDILTDAEHSTLDHSGVPGGVGDLTAADVEGVGAMLARHSPGLYQTSPIASLTTHTRQNGEALYYPYPVGETYTLDRIAIGVTSAGTAGAVIRLGIYEDTGDGFPGALLLDAGTVDAATTGEKEITIAQQITPGLFWLVAVIQGAPATPPTTRAGTGKMYPVADFSLTELGRGAYRETAITGAFPATANPSGTLATGHLVAVRRAA